MRTAFDDQLGPAGGESAIGLVPNFAASRVANRFDFRGPAYTVDAACASSLVAVDHAVRELASGRCDAVLAGAVHHCHVATLWSVFTQLKALSPSQAIRPFDRRADGTLMSEGTGIVLLKRLADAERAGDRVYAVIRGTGVASDGRASSLMSPLSAGQLLAVEQAWTDAGLDPTAADAIGLLEAHGTATPTGDQVELETVARAFGGRSRGGDLVPLGTVKSNIGHAMPAAGIAGLIKAALAVHHGVRPPTLHVEEPHPALAPTRFRPVTELEPWDRTTATSPRRAGVNAFGFGGINAHVVLEEAPGWRTGPRRAAATGRPGRGGGAGPAPGRVDHRRASPASWPHPTTSSSPPPAPPRPHPRAGRCGWRSSNPRSAPWRWPGRWSPGVPRGRGGATCGSPPTPFSSTRRKKSPSSSPDSSLSSSPGSTTWPTISAWPGPTSPAATSWSSAHSTSSPSDVFSPTPSGASA